MIRVSFPHRPFLGLLALWALGSVTLAKAEDPAPGAVGEDMKLKAVEAAVEKLASQRGARSGFVGFSLRFLESEGVQEMPVIPDAALEVLGSKSLVPASTMKIITTGTALATLGADYQLATSLQHDGTIDPATGVLNGNLFIVGSGDPTLAEDGWSGLFGEWLAALEQSGIKSITGSVVGDDSAFSTQAVSGAWAWDDIGNYYAPPVSALNFHRNTFFISFRPSVVGNIAKLAGTSPKVPELEFVNEMRTGTASSGDQGYVYGAPYATTYFLRGSVPQSSGRFSIKGGLPDPAFFCAHRLATFLKAKEIAVQGESTTTRRGAFDKKATRSPLHTHQSPKLVDLIRPVNHESLNLDAEALLKVLGKGNTTGGAKAVMKFLSLHKIDTTGLDMVDGCGLARGNAITPNQMSAVLTLFHQHSATQGFRASLPVAGRSGTLKSIGRGTSAEGRIRAKSGTVHRTKCYAGYVDCRSGRKAAFAIMVNQYSGEYAPVKAGITSIMARLADM